MRVREESGDAWFLVGYLDGQPHSLSRGALRWEEPWGRWYLASDGLHVRELHGTLGILEGYSAV